MHVLTNCGTAAVIPGADLRGLLAWSRPRWAGKRPSNLGASAGWRE